MTRNESQGRISCAMTHALDSAYCRLALHRPVKKFIQRIDEPFKTGYAKIEMFFNLCFEQSRSRSVQITRKRLAVKTGRLGSGMHRNYLFVYGKMIKFARGSSARSDEDDTTSMEFIFTNARLVRRALGSNAKADFGSQLHFENDISGVRWYSPRRFHPDRGL